MLLLLGALSACRREPQPPWNLLLITVDTLRADRLGAYGATQPTSPAMDALARGGTLFETAISTCPSTAPAVASIHDRRPPRDASGVWERLDDAGQRGDAR